MHFADHTLSSNRSVLGRMGGSSDDVFGDITSYSASGGIFQTLSRFIHSVNEMDETILVPCRLIDMRMDTELIRCISGRSSSSTKLLQETTERDAAIDMFSVVHTDQQINGKTLSQGDQSDLFSLYQILNSVKSDLLSGVSMAKNGLKKNATIAAHIGNANEKRRASSVSVDSTPVSDSESDNGQETDSGLEENHEDCAQSNNNTATTIENAHKSNKQDSNGIRHVEQLSAHFRHHLIGLEYALHQMAEAANLLTQSYQRSLSANV